jgi:hypothetical protein
MRIAKHKAPKVKRALAIGLLAALSLSAAAAELEGVRLEDRIRAGGQELQLNGIALRTRAFFKVYVAGLYLQEKVKSADSAFAAPGAKRVSMVMLRDVGGETFATSLADGLRENLSDAELAKLKPQIEELMAAIGRIGEAKKGMSIVLDYAPAGGTTIQVNGAPQGKPIGGEDFFRALLKIWLGDRPVSTDMKKALLAG